MNPTREPTRVPVAFTDGGSDITAPVVSAITTARSAQARWARSPLAQRLEMVRELRRLIAENAGALTEASASARLRPVLESLTAEVLPLAEACRFLERNAAKLLAPRRLGRRGLPLWLSGVRSEIHREPMGVVLIIGPGNYPLLLPGVQLIQALVAGNAVLLKPGIGGSAAARALCRLLARAGLDPQLVVLLPECPEAARAAMLARPDKVLFTGSAATGETILTQLAPLLIPATMELSGCDAVIVRADADVELVVKALMFGLTLNSGATCMSPKRVFVARGIATELEGGLARAFNPSPEVGFGVNACATSASDMATSEFGFNPCSSRGHRAQTSVDQSQSLLTSAATEKMRPLLDDALALGAHFIAGEVREDGAIIAPVVLAGVSPSSRLLQDDVFAPVLALVTVADDHEAIRRTNDCPFGLTASIFTRDETAARSLAAQIKAGVVTINDLIVPTADARVPFGGRKRSGFGVTRGADGLLALTTPKVVTVSRSKFRPAFDAPRPGDAGMFQAYLEFTHGRGLKSRGAALLTLIRSISGRTKSSRKETT